MNSTNQSSLGELVRSLNEARPFELADEVAVYLRRTAHSDRCTLLLADYAEQALEPVPSREGGQPFVEQSIEGTAAGAAYRSGYLSVHDEDGAAIVFVPVTVRSERLGILALRVPSPDASTQSILGDVGLVVANALLASRGYTDRFERIRRRRDLELAAEIQWELLPVLAYDSSDFAIAGSLEPAYEIGGDIFDYSVAEKTVTVGITDAMGHGIKAALLSSLTVNTMRNCRRRGDNLVGQVGAAADQVSRMFDEGYVSGFFFTMNQATGAALAVNAGHLPPVLLRDGAVSTLEIPPSTPLAMFTDTEYRTHPISLHPGDRLILHTDGITEAHPRHGAYFGDQKLADILLETQHNTAREVVRLLTSEVSEHMGGDLRDDATAVCFDWRR
ncbi:MAG: SpoIIE family protein phosphatase [Aeromicrobium sp.]